jgi:uncharacterized protein YjbI with pentapeptide repeats
MKTRPTFRLDQSALERRDFASLRNALSRSHRIDARGLRIDAERLGEVRALMRNDSTGRSRFFGWHLQNCTFGAGCDFSRADFRSCWFDSSEFGDGANFCDSTFDYGNFKSTCFGNDTLFERVNLKMKAEFRGATFGDRCRFAYARFKSSQFFDARFGSDASFARVNFTASAKFHSSRFGPRANFAEAQFPVTVDFAGADFGEKLQMVSVRFAGSPAFVGASFGTRARLTRWRVAGTLVMRAARFLGEMSLHGLRVEGDAIFEHAHFYGYVDLGEITIGGAGYFDGVGFTSATRVGPIASAQELRMGSLMTHSACLLELSAPRVDLSDSRFLAPARIALARGDAVLDRVDPDSRLVITAPTAPDADHPARLVSVRGADLGTFVVSGLDVRALRFEGAEGIDGMKIESGASFEPSPRGLRTHREAIAEEHRLRNEGHGGGGWLPAACENSETGEGPAVTAGKRELARIYRGLRKAREDAHDRPGSADFYYGEMEMRRLEARERIGKGGEMGAWFFNAGSLLLLELYRLIGGYGVRPSRPLLLFAALALGTAAFVEGDSLIHVEVARQGNLPLLADVGFEQSLVFVLRSALLLPTSAGLALSTSAEWIQIGARLLGPLLIGLFAFGLRARVHR